MQDDGLDNPITLYFWSTPNGFKIAIMLEELGAPYRTKFIDITKGEQFAPEFLAVAPNNRIPAIVDPDGPDGQPLSIFNPALFCNISGASSVRFTRQANVRRRRSINGCFGRSAALVRWLGNTSTLNM